MNAEFYDQFVTLKNLGRKAEAMVALDSFIASFNSKEEIEAWVYPFLEAEDYGHKIRHEIYEQLVYPILLDGYLKDEVRSVTWLAKTAANLYRLKTVHPRLEQKNDFDLYREAHALEPNEEIRIFLLKRLTNWFHYAGHEWPAGILYGTDAAGLAECEDILHEIEFARSLDHLDNHELFIADFESKVRQCIERLREDAATTK